MLKFATRSACAVLSAVLLQLLAPPAEGQSLLKHQIDQWERTRVELQMGLSMLADGRTRKAKDHLSIAVQNGHVLARYGHNVALATRILVMDLAAQEGAVELVTRLRQENARIVLEIGNIDQRLIDYAPFYLRQAHQDAETASSDTPFGQSFNSNDIAAYIHQRIFEDSQEISIGKAMTLHERSELYKKVEFLKAMAAHRPELEMIAILTTAVALTEANLGFDEQYTLEIVVRYFQLITGSRILTDLELEWLSRYVRVSRIRHGPHSEIAQGLRYLLLEQLRKTGKQDIALELELAMIQLSIDLVKLSRPFGSWDPEGQFLSEGVARAAHNVRRLAIQVSELPERRIASSGFRRDGLVEIAYRAAQLELVGPLTLASRDAKLKREARKAGMFYTHNWDGQRSRSAELWLELDDIEGRSIEAIQKTIKDLKHHTIFSDHGEAKFEVGVPHLFDLLKPETIGANEIGEGRIEIDEDTALILIASGSDDSSDTAIFVQTDKGLAHAKLDWTISEFSSAIAEFRNSILGTPNPSDQIAMRAPLGQVSQIVTGPVDLELGFEIHQAIFSDPSISKHLRSKSNWIVAARGPFLSLPFAALPTRRTMSVTQDAEQLRKTPWLGMQKNLQFVGSLADAARAPTAKDTSEATPRSGYIGFGDPLFSGAPRRLRTSDYKNLESDNRRLAAVTSLPRLPATRKEVIETGALFPSANRIVRLGHNATEAELHSMSAVGSLRNLSVLHFATHGILEGGVGDIGAALALTPPEVVTPIAPGIVGDGLLTIAEIGLLQMDLDLVVLSACNTASGERNGGEALTGLARVFLEAGARSVLATHWAVEDDAAQKIVSSTLRGVANDDNVAVALRESIAEMISDRSRDHTSVPFSHPQVWAPFVAFSSR